MKILKIIFSLLFVAVICLPLCFFNLDTGAVSEIDNRALAGNPFTSEGDLTGNIENYVNDRIGFRNEMINGYTVLNDRVFGEMVHPNYSYGKDGYVFGAGLTTVKNTYTDYHREFAKAVKNMQDYCTERNIPFVFVFNPAKPAVLQEYIPDSINYDRTWVDGFFKELDGYGVNYVDNTVTLTQEKNNGNIVFNQKYDANHWNDLGAFYGTNAVLENLQQFISEVHINDIGEFNVEEKVETSLPVSSFAINETVPAISLKNEDIINSSEEYYDEIDRHPSYTAFGYFTNNERADENAPKAFVFQGSYMNSYGYKYFANSFSEYIYVHDYQNVFNFEYYINIFNPDCVIFEVAEYTFSDGYFSYEKLQNFELAPALSSVKQENVREIALKDGDLTVVTKSEQGAPVLTEIIWNTSYQYSAVWMKFDRVLDMIKTDSGYTVTVKTEDYEKFKNQLRITVYD